MGENSAIEWCDHTFNPWSGCLKISPACDHCYAEALAKRSPRTFGSWLPGGPRKRTSETYWRQPLKWNREAAAGGVRRKVFCASMADVFDNQVPKEWRWALWDLIVDTPHLDWLLLTKRPQNIRQMLPFIGPERLPLRNVWLGTTVENQAEADRRIPHLLAVPAAVHFLSCEPLLGPVDLEGYLADLECGPRISWVISGGESGPKARPSHPDWHRSLRDQCASAGVPFFFKQWGEWIDWRQMGASGWQNVTPQGPGYRGPTMGIFSRGGERLLDGRAIPTRFICAAPGRIGDPSGRVGKKAAGALLDGREHRAFPRA